MGRVRLVQLRTVHTAHTAANHPLSSTLPRRTVVVHSGPHTRQSIVVWVQPLRHSQHTIECRLRLEVPVKQAGRRSVIVIEKDVIYCWDVVNEAVEDHEDKLLRTTPWSEAIGDEYVRKAFEFAHEADPDALLFYNDYAATVPAKREKIYKLLKGLLDEGVPVHGVGMQGHWNIAFPPLDDIKAAIERYASLGLDVQITELDVSVYPGDQKADHAPPGEEAFEKQAEFYGKIFEIFRSYRDVITGVTFWGVADDRTWLDRWPVKVRKNYPLLFDVNHQPKEAFYRVVNWSNR